MKKFFVIILCFQVFYFGCLAQSELKDLNTRISVLLPGISFEKRIAEKYTLYAGLQSKMPAYKNENLDDRGGLFLQPSLLFQLRRYLDLRNNLGIYGRSPVENSGYYVAVIEKLLYNRFPVIAGYYQESRRIRNNLGLVFGQQYNGEKRFSLDYNAGVAWRMGNEDVFPPSSGKNKRFESGAKFIGQLNLGVWINKRKQVIKKDSNKI